MDKETVARLMEDYCNGAETAFHTLRELAPSWTSTIIQLCEDYQNRFDLVRILEVLAERRDDAALQFFLRCLQSSDEPVWKCALDGIAATGAEAALTGLKQFLNECDEGEKRNWIREAVDHEWA